MGANETAQTWKMGKYGYPEDMIMLPDGTFLGYFQQKMKRMALTEDGMEDLWKTSLEDGWDDCDGVRVISVIPPSANHPLRVVVPTNSGFVVMQ
eukprot:TRINITY_DN11587_c0_g1_i3.p3 TRINITY_DN11587_c0_g1~~TRINITY_DN11587_c0_g1_i3.p3  ORF type:complete len:102 (-),score=34.93 TRINITY_DN11587_c0_g1_i3:137-418(-)